MGDVGEVSGMDEHGCFLLREMPHTAAEHTDCGNVTTQTHSSQSTTSKAILTQNPLSAVNISLAKQVLGFEISVD